MAGSQKSFESQINRFDNGYTLVNGWVDYNPTNALIKKAALGTFIQDVKNANEDVDTKLETLTTARDSRLLLVFKKKEENPACLEQRIIGIRNYIKGENFPKSALSAIEKIIQKIRPRYTKKPEGAPEGSGKSPSEKSFAAAVGFGANVVNIITNLGIDYNPPDPNLAVGAVTTLVANIETANKDTQKALDNYGISNRARLKLYEGTSGLEERRSAVLNYLASFPGLKKSNHYIEFNDALKGV